MTTSVKAAVTTVSGMSDKELQALRAAADDELKQRAAEKKRKEDFERWQKVLAYFKKGLMAQVDACVKAGKPIEFNWSAHGFANKRELNAVVGMREIFDRVQREYGVVITFQDQAGHSNEYGTTDPYVSIQVRPYLAYLTPAGKMTDEQRAFVDALVAEINANSN